MNQELKDKIQKITELINRGATDGEKKAAKKALERIMNKYNIDESQLKDIDLKEYKFGYTSDLEEWLLVRLLQLNTAHGGESCRKRPWERKIRVNLNYSDWVTIECSYEYFRRHMKKEWRRTCLPELSKCRKQKTRNARRKELQDLFFSQYVIASRLCKDEDIKEVEINSGKELKDRRMLSGIEGGQYNRQVYTNLLLEK